MQLVAHKSRRHFTKYLLKTSTLLSAAVPKYQFCTAQQQKSPEFSAENEPNSPAINPLFQSISDSELFETIKQSKTSPVRHSNVELKTWERQHRALVTVDSSHQYASILNARSVDEIRQQLQKHKDNFQSAKQQRTLNLVDSIVSNTAHNNETATNPKPAAPVDTRFLSEATCKAIHMCGYLKEYDAGFAIFEQTKRDRIGLTSNVFAAAIWLAMERHFSHSALNKAFQIRDDMEHEYKIKPSAKVYQQLLTNALGLREFHRAAGLVKTIMNMEESEKSNLLNDHIGGTFLRVAVLKFYTATKQIDKALKFMNYSVQKFGKKSMTDHGYSCMISGIGQVVYDGDKSLVAAGEKLFQQSFDVLGRAPKESVFLSLMKMYASVPDFNSSFDILQEMISNDSLPNPTSFSYSCCLKALNEYGRVYPFGYEEGWENAEKILGLMKEYEEKRHCAVYSLLFNLCSGTFCGRPDLERLYGYYEEMVAENVQLNPSGAQNLLLAGVDCYIYKVQQSEDGKECLKEECMKFVDWALVQYKRHNVTLIQFHQNNLQYKLDILNELM